jgi:ribosomal protein L37E
MNMLKFYFTQNQITKEKYTINSPRCSHCGELIEHKEFVATIHFGKGATGTVEAPCTRCGHETRVI